MKITKTRLKEIVKTAVISESEYREFFQKALEKAGKSIPAMSDEEKKAFFNKIDAAWDARGEKNEELTGNQHKLDIDGDGEIEGSDLAALRAGKKADESVNEVNSKYTKGQIVNYIPKLSGLNPNKKLEIDSINYRKGDSLTKGGWYYGFKGTSLTAHENDIKISESVNEGKKRFKQQDGIGSSKYTISYHDGKKKHKDGSDFFDIKIFKNKPELEAFKKDLVSKGFISESVNEAKFDRNFAKKIESIIKKELGVGKLKVTGPHSSRFAGKETYFFSIDNPTHMIEVSKQDFGGMYEDFYDVILTNSRGHSHEYNDADFKRISDESKVLKTVSAIAKKYKKQLTYAGMGESKSVNEVKYPTDLKVGSVIQGQGFTRLKGIDGGKYYKIVDMDDTTATLVPSDKNGNTKGSTKVRHKLDSIEGGIKTAKRGDENGIVVIKEGLTEANDKLMKVGSTMMMGGNNLLKPVKMKLVSINYLPKDGKYSYKFQGGGRTQYYTDDVLAKKLKSEGLNEGMYDQKIKSVMQNSTSSFKNLGNDFKNAGLKYNFSTTPFPHYIVDPGGNKKVAIINRKNEYDLKGSGIQYSTYIATIKESVNEARSVSKPIRVDDDTMVQIVGDGKYFRELTAAVDRKTGKPIQKFGFDRGNEIENSKEELIAKLQKKYGKTIKFESVNEGVSPKDMDKIKSAVEAASSFMNVGAQLKSAGLRYIFATEPMAIYIVNPTPNTKVAIVNKKYASKPDFVHGDIAVGIMEGLVNEEFKHIISVDTPTQVISKPVAAQILALAKKGVRSKEIGLKMGFVGNNKQATDAFQKVKNQIYFALDKRNESVKEATHSSAPGQWVGFVDKQRGKKIMGVFKSASSAKAWLTKNQNSLLNKPDVERVGIMTKADWDTKEAKYAIESVVEAKNIKWQDVEVGDSANVTSINKTGVIVKTYGRKFHIKFANGTTKTYDASELEFIKESVVKEVASRTAVEIAALTGTNKDFIQNFVDKNELDIEKVFQYVKKGKLKDRMDFVTAVAGKPNNPYQVKLIKQFKESVINGSNIIKEVEKVPMIKDIIKKAKLQVKDGIVKLDDKHVWLRKKSIVNAMQALNKYKTGVKEEKANDVISRFLINYDDGVDTLQVIYFRDIRKSS